MSEITPEQVAAALTGGDDVNEVLNRWVDVNAIPGSSTVRITVTPINDAGDPDTENAQHFRAVVFEGETAPIVLDRLKTGEYSDDFEGGAYGNDDAEGWQTVFYSHAKQRTCFPWEADSILFRGAPGVISAVEARRFAAALASLADAVEAAQAVQKGGQDV